MSKLDDILLQFGNYQSSRDKQIVKWKADIKDLMLEIIGGPDEPYTTEANAIILHRNQLRTELRKKVKEL